MAKVTTTKPIDLTTAEVAKRLGIKSRSVLGLIERGHFPNAHKLPALHATYLIPCSDLDDYLAKHEARRKRKSAQPEKG